MNYSVKKLSRLGGVSVRTLHFYDQIDLLKPASYAENGYRSYGKDELFLLQQILFYKELGFSLEKIKTIIGKSDFNLVSALDEHKTQLEMKRNRLKQLITTIEETIQHLKGKIDMEDKQLFRAFSEEEQEKYALEAEQIYDNDTVRESNKKWKSYSPEKKQQVLDEGNRIYLDIVKAIPMGAGSEEVQACIARWRKHMDYFWTPSLEQLVKLAEGYNNHLDFKKNFDKINPRLAKFMLEAVTIYVEKERLTSRKGN